MTDAVADAGTDAGTDADDSGEQPAASGASLEDPGPSGPAEVAPEPADPDAETQIGRHRPSGPDDDPDWYKPRPGPRPPVPELEPMPERPLFAPDGGRPRPVAAPTSVTTSWGSTDWAEQHPGKEWASAERRDEEPRWPMGRDHDPVDTAHEWESPRHWLRLPLIIGLLAVVAIVVAFLLAFQGGGGA